MCRPRAPSTPRTCLLSRQSVCLRLAPDRIPCDCCLGDAVTDQKERAVGLPKPTLATVFEVVAAGKVYRVTGTALQTWIVEKRRTWNGPKGYLFCKRPGLE
jgi:hypothetical protein